MNPIYLARLEKPSRQLSAKESSSN